MSEQKSQLGHDHTVELVHVEHLQYSAVEIRDDRSEYVELLPKEALELLKWLYEHNDELEALAKEQAS